MREIKFRAWDGKVMWDAYFHISAMGIIWRWKDGQELHGSEVFDCQVMQFTGLKDKNGKEIYEGDIVEAKNFIDMPYIITWHVGGFGIRYIGNPIPIYVNAKAWDNMEIIGNIYENPELLK